MGDRTSPVKMTGQLDFSSVKICFRPVIDTLTLTVKQTIRNFFQYIIVSYFNSRLSNHIGRLENVAGQNDR